MNEYILLGIAVLGASALPAWASFFAIKRAKQEAEWQDALWADHQREDTSTPPKPVHDEKKRTELRREIRDLAGISSVTSMVALKGGALAFLVILEVALLWHLTHHDPIPLNQFWVLTSIIGAVLPLIVFLVGRSSQDR